MTMRITETLARYRAQYDAIRVPLGWQPPVWDDDARLLADALVAGAPKPVRCMTRGPIPVSVGGWHATREPRYAQAARQAFAEAVLGQEAANLRLPSLTQAVWLGQWAQHLVFMLDSEAFDLPFCADILGGMTRLIEQVVATMCPASMNWRIAEAARLLYLSLLLEAQPRAEDWRGVAVRALNDAAHRQINADGSHRERNPHYHIWMTRELTEMWRLGRALPALGLRIPAERLAAMWDYALFCNRPNGTENGLHDSRGLFTGGMPDEVRRDRDTFLREAGLPGDLPAPNGWFPDAGQAVLRDSWDDDCTYVTFDATRWGESHCHYSRNAMQIHAFGRTLLGDPGVFEYRNTPLGNYGRSTRAHATLNLNGWNQTQTNPSRLDYRHADGYDLVLADYEGTYHPGPSSMVNGGGLGPGLWASHHRCLLWMHGRALVVIDSFVRVPDTDEIDPPTLESNWQFAPGPVCWDPAAQRLCTGHPDANLLLLFPALPEGWTAAVHEGETDPPRGFVAEETWAYGRTIPNFGTPLPAPQFSLTLSPMRGARAEFLTVLLPFRGAEPPVVQATGQPATLREPGTLTLTWADGSTDNLRWSYRLDLGLGEFDGLDTDAALLHRRRTGKTIHGLAVDATYLHPYLSDMRATPGMLRF